MGRAMGSGEVSSNTIKILVLMVDYVLECMGTDPKTASFEDIVSASDIVTTILYRNYKRR